MPSRPPPPPNRPAAPNAIVTPSTGCGVASKKASASASASASAPSSASSSSASAPKKPVRPNNPFSTLVPHSSPSSYLEEAINAPSQQQQQQHQPQQHQSHANSRQTTTAANVIINEGHELRLLHQSRKSTISSAISNNNNNTTLANLSLSGASASASASASSSAVNQNQNQNQQHPSLNYNANINSKANYSTNNQETISVTLDDSSYYQRQRQILCQKFGDVKQKLAANNPFFSANLSNTTTTTTNDSSGGRPTTSNDPQHLANSSKEKYTMDMVNELRGDNEQFNWNQGDGEREMWESKLQYFLAVTSYSIGLGNVWRFPMLVQKNGGAAFIIPFIIMLVVEGIPLFYLELAIGQRIRKAAVSCWNSVSPFAAGIGIASAVVSFNIGLYYNTVVAWCIYYLWSSLKSPLPFSVCPKADLTDQVRNTQPLNQSTLRPTTTYDYVPECQNSSPTQYYWYRETLGTSDDVEQWTGLNYPIVLCLAISWLTSYVCLVKGLSSAKKIVYVTSTFPYIILTIFFIKAMTLEGMSDGVYHLFEPNWSKLADPHVWLQSAAQVFYSLGLGFGGLIALSSYNPVNNNCYRDAISVSIINSLTSLYVGVVIFAILGFKAHVMFDKCVANRDLMIDFYLGDHNLKVIDYGSVFNLSSVTDDGSVTDYYDLSDALNAIQSLDEQLSSQGDIDYGDSDTEFIVDAGNMISSEYLKSLVDSIPNLPQCDLKKELDRTASGTGLAFIVFTEAINQFPNASLWSILFFMMLLTLGLDSQFGTLEGLLSSIADLKLSPRMNREYATGLICGVSFAISLIMFAHGSGNYIFSIFDQFAGNFPLVIIALFELLAISYIYGLKRFNDDCELMTGKRPSIFILLCWRYIAPITLIVVIIASLGELDTTLNYQAWISSKASLEVKPWPTWCLVIGAVLVLSVVIWIPVVAILRVLKINLIEAESFSQCWFPADELREYHNIQEEPKVSKWERLLFGFTSEDDY